MYIHTHTHTHTHTLQIIYIRLSLCLGVIIFSQLPTRNSATSVCLVTPPGITHTHTLLNAHTQKLNSKSYTLKPKP